MKPLTLLTGLNSLGKSSVIQAILVIKHSHFFCSGKRVELKGDLQQLDQGKCYIPINANIVSRYSGDPAFNLQGKLVGFSNAAYVGDLSAYDFDYLGFIIPIDRVKELIEENCALSVK